MQISHSNVQKIDLAAAMTAQPINTYMGWEIFLSRVFKDRTDKGLWLHWCYPVDQKRERALRYGYFIAPEQPLEKALHAVYQSIEAIVELESMAQSRPFVQPSERFELGWQAPDWEVVSVNA